MYLEAGDKYLLTAAICIKSSLVSRADHEQKTFSLGENDLQECEFGRVALTAYIVTTTVNHWARKQQNHLESR